MKAKSKKNGNFPNLRFPGFTEEWEVKKLGEISRNIMYGINAAAIEYDGSHQYIRITDIDESTRLFCPNPLSSPDGKLQDKYLLKEGDILFARTGASVGKSYFHNRNNEKVFFAGFLIRFTIIDNNPFFIFLQTLTNEYQKWVFTMSIRSGQPGINAEEYKSLIISLPSFAEQNKVATFFSLIDKRIQTQSKIIEECEKQLEGICQNLIQSRTANKKIKDCVYCHSSSLTETDVLDKKGTFPVYGATGIISFTPTYQVNENAILIIKDGSGVGKVQYAENNFSVIGTLNYLTSKPRINLKYVFYCLRFFNFQKYKVGSGIPHIYFKDYGEALIFCPSFQEQKRIESLLSSLEKKINITRALLSVYKKQKEYFLQNLFI